MKKKNFKNVVFYTSSILGDYTIQELIYFLQNQLIRSQRLDNVLLQILTDKGFDYKSTQNIIKIADTSYNLKFIIDMLNDNL